MMSYNKSKTMLAIESGNDASNSARRPGQLQFDRVLRQVWAQAIYQLYLFHETRRGTSAVMKLINRVQIALEMKSYAG
jgi:hypothetical protein